MLIDNVNGGFAINRSGGHVHFFWIKGGLLFKLGAGVYAGVRLGNTIGNEFNWKKEQRAIAYCCCCVCIWCAAAEVI